ncbi:GNAT family N-acetyltransferase [Sporosarcina gallistercoris]|uniref:GNAT family N-acetyltransferase n=1 Tax=Sporosarcina gallistercoris TaxID=2762245 RepID=A0ABR8PK60_9BACL|nr:GNAT family N-acetyltransferase [Sporosarcina gallistercoris]MBD7908541.1 GNAT family N-acetyltransferase [Sporosarcina gallistercoris]
MLEHAIAMAKFEGAGIVQLTTDKQRVAAHPFYERLGFTASLEGMKLILLRRAFISQVLSTSFLSCKQEQTRSSGIINDIVHKQENHTFQFSEGCFFVVFTHLLSKYFRIYT